MCFRENTAIDLVFIESGVLPLKVLIQKRELKFFRKFKENFRTNSVRKSVFNMLLENENLTGFLKHYVDLDTKYDDPKKISSDALDEIKIRVLNKSTQPENHYKFHIYH